MENEMWAWSKQFKRLEKKVPCEKYSVSSRRRDVFDNKLTVPKEKTRQTKKENN